MYKVLGMPFQPDIEAAPVLSGGRDRNFVSNSDIKTPEQDYGHHYKG